MILATQAAPANADNSSQASWVNAATIEYNGQSFVTSGIGNLTYTEQAPSDGCAGTITLTKDPGGNDGRSLSVWSNLDQNVNFQSKTSAGSASSKCINNPNINHGKALSVQLSSDSAPAANVSFKWIDSNHIESVDGKVKFTFDKNSKAPNAGDLVYARDNGGGCSDFITVSGGNYTNLVLNIRSNQGSTQSATTSMANKWSDWPIASMPPSGKPPVSTGAAAGCFQSIYNTTDSPDSHWGPNGGLKVTADPSKASPPDATQTGPTSGSGTASIKCSTTLANPLTWLICPIIDSAQSAVQSFYNGITNELDINVQTYFDTSAANSSGNALYQSWSSIRYISLSLIVVIALIMVVSQALSLDIFDAYTIKKVLPRLVFAIIFITLSWEIAKFAIQFADDVGRGLRTIIELPFAQIGNPKAIGGTTLLAGAGIGVSLLATFGIVGTLSFVVIALIAVVVAFATLVFRKMLVVILVVLAPFAIVCWILPNTQKVWKMWSDNFFKALMLFPLISIFFAAGNVFAKIAGSEPGSNGLLQQLIVFGAVFGPLFMLPMAFKMAGGALGGVHGIYSRGGAALGAPASKLRAGRQKKQAEKWAQRGAKARSGELFGGKSYIPGSEAAANRLNAMTRGFGQGAGSLYGLGATARQRSRADAEKGAVIENAANDIMKGPGWAPVMNNEEALRAGTYKTENAARSALKARYRAEGNSEEEATSRVNNAVAGFKATGHKFGNEAFQFAAAKQLVETGTGYDNMADMASTLARSANSNRGTAAALSGFANSRTKTVGRADLAPGFGTLNSLVGNAMGRPGNTMDPAMVQGAQEAASRGMDAVSVLRGKPTNLRNHAQTLVTGLSNNMHAIRDADAAIASATTSEQKAAATTARTNAADEAKRMLGQINQLSANKSYASVENQGIVNKLQDNTLGVADNLVEILSGGDAEVATRERADIQRLSAPPQYASSADSPTLRREE